MQKSYLIMGAASGVLAAGSFYAGYKYAFKKCYLAFDGMLAEETQKAKEFYANLHKAEYPTPADAAAALVPDEKLLEATEALRGYLGAEERVMEDDEPEERNIFENGDQLQIHVEQRDTSKPYIVGLDEYVENEQQYDDIQLTYYEGDNVLADDSEEPIEDVDGVVGHMNLNLFGISDPDQPHILLVRNEQKKMNIEVARSQGKFAHEVLSFEHSDEPMRRSRRRWDDD